MSNRDNHRRGEKRRTEHGPRWESKDPGAGCNSTHVARSRKKYKRRHNRTLRRTGETSKILSFGRSRVLPESEG